MMTLTHDSFGQELVLIIVISLFNGMFQQRNLLAKSRTEFVILVLVIISKENTTILEFQAVAPSITNSFSFFDENKIIERNGKDSLGLRLIFLS